MTSRDELIELRKNLYSSKQLIQAHLLEQTFLNEHPDDIQFLYFASWTSKALGYSEKSEEYHYQMISNYLQQQLASKAKHKKNIELVVEKSTKNHSLFKQSDKFECSPLIQKYDVDDVPLWILQQHSMAVEGDVVNINPFGLFRIGNVNNVVYKRLARNLPWEMPVALTLMELASRLNKNAVIVDIGANVGTISIPIAKHFEGKVFAYEPVEENLNKMLDNINLNSLQNLIVGKKAIGSFNGTVALENPNPKNPGMYRVSEHSGGETPINTLDDEMASLSVGLIKMDVEGHELEVLKGAQKTIEKSSPIIVCEILSSDSDSMHKTFLDLGYKGLKLFRSDWLFYRK